MPSWLKRLTAPLRSLWKRSSARDRVALCLLPALIAACVLAVLAAAAPQPPVPTPPTKSFSGLIARIDDGKVKRLDFDPNRLQAEVTETDAKVQPYVIGVPATAGTDSLLAAARREHVDVRSQPLPSGGASPVQLIFGALPVLLIVVLMAVAYRTMRPSGPKRHSRSETDVTFDDVAGCGEAVEELADVREFLADPARFEKLGARVPKGVLLYGPPGTGKTLLAKAIATESKADFYAVAGSDFVEMFAGLGARRVRGLFGEVKRRNKPAIVFFDELDAIGKTRSGGGGDGGTREADQTLTQLLTEMDGFTAAKHPIIVMAATNHPDALDPALLRPGRFDRRVSVDPPDRAGRRAILDVHARGKRLADDVDLDGLADHTAGMTGAELANVLNETVLEAARRNADQADESDLENAFFRIVAGAKKHNRALSDHERKVVAYHETGHALAGELLAAADKVHKISIIPRGQSGGQTLLVSDQDVFLHSRQALLDRITWTLAGRAAEQLIFNEVTTGAGDDLKRASDLAYKMVAQLGMGQSVGLRVVDDQHPVSAARQTDIDDECSRLLDSQLDRAVSLLDQHGDEMERIAQALLAEEVIDRARFLELLNRDATADKHHPIAQTVELA